MARDQGICILSSTRGGSEAGEPPPTLWGLTGLALVPQGSRVWENLASEHRGIASKKTTKGLIGSAKTLAVFQSPVFLRPVREVITPDEF